MTHQAIEVRPAGLDDASEIARLNGLFNGSTEPPEAYLPRLADPERVDTPLLAWVEGKAAGIANLRLARQVFYPEPYAELSELFVEEAYRRRGIGRALILHAEELARQAGATEMVILTGFENFPARELYRGLRYANDDLAVRKKLGLPSLRGNFLVECMRLISLRLWLSLRFSLRSGQVRGDGTGEVRP